MTPLECLKMLLADGWLDNHVVYDFETYQSIGELVAEVIKAAETENPMESELDILRHRVKWCETSDEAEKMALIRALQEISQAVGISATKFSPEQIVDAVKGMIERMK